jgi:hypothetical protein
MVEGIAYCLVVVAAIIVAHHLAEGSVQILSDAVHVLQRRE